MALEHVQNYNGLKRNVQEKPQPKLRTARGQQKFTRKKCIHYFDPSEFIAKFLG